MGLPKNYLSNDSPDELLSDEAIAIIEHIGQILAEEYVQLLKLEKTKTQTEEEKNESSSLRKILK